MKKVGWLFCVISPLLMAQTTFYQCDVAGVVTFSQFPCDKSAKGQQPQSVGHTATAQQDFRLQQRELLKKRQRFLEYQQQALDSQYQQRRDQLTSVLHQQHRSSAAPGLQQQTQAQLQELQTDYQRQVAELQSQRAELELQLEQLEQHN